MRHTDRGFILSVAGCAAATTFFAVALARALTVDAAPAPKDTTIAAPVAAGMEPTPDEIEDAGADDDAAPLVREGEAAAASASRPLSLDALRLAVENDPFREDRQRPAERYRMPGDPVLSEGPPLPPPPPPFQVLGIAQSASGGLAIMQIEDTPPRVLAVGESLLGYTLDRVDGEVATMSGQGRTLSLTVAQASPNPPAAEDDDDERSSRGRRGREAEEVLERLRGRRDADRNVEQVREMQENAVEMIRRMMEQQQQRGNNRGGNNDASSVYFVPSTMDRYRVGVPLQRGRITIRADTNTAPLPRR